MRRLVLFLVLCLPVVAYAGNVKDTDLITSNTFFLPPTTADVQITDRRLGKLFGQPVAQTPTGPKVQHMRMVGHVRQKDLDIPEATPIIQEKINTGIAGLF